MNKEIVKRIEANIAPIKVKFFKTEKGDYAEHDQFIGVNVPTLRVIAKEFAKLPLSEIQLLLESPINEYRLLALIILVNQYQKGDEKEKLNIFQFYLHNLNYVNNWNLVDTSAPSIIGHHLLNEDKELLMELAKSDVMWKRRIAMVTTQHFIRNNQFDWTIKLAEVLLNDKHDLIHKAVGWMLREVGERDLNVLKKFLEKHTQSMPRTMLRYAIEKFPQDERKVYLQK